MSRIKIDEPSTASTVPAEQTPARDVALARIKPHVEFVQDPNGSSGVFQFELNFGTSFTHDGLSYGFEMRSGSGWVELDHPIDAVREMMIDWCKRFSHQVLNPSARAFDVVRGATLDDCVAQAKRIDEVYGEAARSKDALETALRAIKNEPQPEPEPEDLGQVHRPRRAAIGAGRKIEERRPS